MIIKGKNASFRGKIEVPGDKSISHRAIMIGSIAKGKTVVENFLMGEDCLSTINCFKDMGVNIIEKKDEILIEGVGLNGLKKPEKSLFVGNSGTTIRLISGILSCQNFSSEITGDDSIRKRPMDRIIKPLRIMGADVFGVNDKYAPLKFNPTSVIKGLTFKQSISSAQVKSCLLLAGLYGNKKTEIIQPSISRNHTELMLKYFGADIDLIDNKVILNPREELIGQEIYVPGDISSAAFLIVGALILEGSMLTIRNVGINDTRIGILKVLERMNGNIKITNIRVKNNEKIGDITVKYSNLKSTIIEGSEIPKLIDEIPILAVAASVASGTTIIKDANELKYKESNRIKSTVNELKKMGINIEELDDGMIIKGNNKIKGNKVNTYFDHRIAMSLVILGLKAEGETEINEINSINISFPKFFDTLNKIMKA